MPKFLTSIDAGNQRLVSLADPSAATDATTKQYVDNLVAGLQWKRDVRVATTTNGTLATAYANGQSIDGQTLVTGDRILIKDQTTQTENGIYTVNVSGAPTRATDADTSAELNNATLSVLSGTVNVGKNYTQTTINPVIGSSNIVWGIFAAGTSYTAGNGLQLIGSSFSILLDTNPALSVSGTGLKVAATIAGAGLAFTAGVIDVTAGTGISTAGDQVSIDTSVVPRKYATAIGDGSATTFTVTHSLATRDVQVSVYQAATPFTVVYADVTYDTTAAVGISFATAPTAGQYRVVVVG